MPQVSHASYGVVEWGRLWSRSSHVTCQVRMMSYILILRFVVYDWWLVQQSAKYGTYNQAGWCAVLGAVQR